MNISYEDNVFEELLNISSYLFDIQEDLAQRFLDSCDATFQFLAANPNIGAPNKFSDPNLASIRMAQVKDFRKYLIIYIATDDEVRILHVIHSATDYNRVFDEDLG